ncbi:MAG: ABC transporter permease, partial [Planctomycetota bacterium]
IIAFSGAILGTTAGYLFAKNINIIARFLEKYTGFQLFPPQEYLFFSIPYYWSWQWVSIVTFLNIGILLFASLIPAIKAARLNPATTLKNE